MLDNHTASRFTRRAASNELERLRRRINQQEHSLTVLVQAVSALRSGNQALQEENRELRLQLQRRNGLPRAS